MTFTGRRVGIVQLGVATLLALSCDSSGPSKRAVEIALLRGDGQSAPVNSPVLIPPAVQVVDAKGKPAAGIGVTFRVTLGGGQVTGGFVTSDGNGIAVVGDWTLGQTVGENRLVATAHGSPDITFTATGIAAPPATVLAVSDDDQTAVVAQPVPAAPTVRVEDGFGNGVPGIQVAFTVTAGNGSVVGDTVVTDLGGTAGVASWTVGPAPGINRLEARVIGFTVTHNPVTFSATAGSNSSFTIDVRFLSSVTGSQQAAFQAARLRLEGLITGDVPDAPVNFPAGACLPSQPAMNETIDDLVIFAEITAIDGPGKTLGQAGPCVTRSGSRLAIIGVMQFDIADVPNLEASGAFPLVILHEMMHVLGFGSIWSPRGLLAGAGGSDPVFTGAEATASFLAIGGNSYPGNPVPVENTGGAGTRDSHWRESVFDNEIMTGFLNSGANPLSVVTAGQFKDLGYTVDASVADPFAITGPFPAPGVSTQNRIALGDDVWRGPLFVVGPAGTVIRLR